MIKKYLDFINESIDLILESNVVYSNNFRGVLNKINTPLAKTMIEIENHDLNVRSNYFDILLAKNDTVTFIPDRKAQEILGDTKEFFRFTGNNGGWLRHTDSNSKLFGILGYTYTEGSTPYSPNSRDIGEIVNKVVSEQSGKTYVWVKFKNREGVDVGEGVYNIEKLAKIDSTKSEEVWISNRQELKIGRAVGALLRAADITEYKPKDIEAFVNLYKSTIDKMNDKFSFFEVVHGNDIAYWYSYVHYYERRGTLGNSCMSGVSDYYFDIYTSNPDQVGLVILKSEKDESKIVGRALLWTLNDGKKFMDRIYTINDSDLELFRDYAKEQGWYSKYSNYSSAESTVVAPSGERINIDIEVTLSKKSYKNFPYLDTLKYFYDNGSGLLTINESSDALLLEDTGGHFIGSECDECGGRGYVTCWKCDGDEVVSCRHCDGDGTINCESCDGSGKNEEGEECSSCDGEGTRECSYCDDGKVRCPECDGHGEVTCPECG